MPSAYNTFRPIEHVIGTDQTINITLKDESGTDISIIGATAEWKVYRAMPRRRRKPWTGLSKITKTSAAGEITLTAGNAAIAIKDTDFGNESGLYWHILLITDSSGNISHQGQGQLSLQAELT